MKQTFKSRLRRAAASALAAAALFSQPILTESAVYAAEPKAAGSPVKVAEQNPFDGLCTSKHSTKISDYNANVMEVEISGEKYLAYCLNPNRYGSDNVSGGAVGSSGYSVQVYDLDDPALQNVPDFQLDQSILLAMQGVIASGGYTGGGDAAAGKLMDPYDASRPLYRDHLQAYAVTKYAMWSLASGWYGPDWKVYSGSAYKPQDNAYDHMRELKRLAVEAGLTAPLYTATAWGNATVVEGETLPVESGYVDAPWDQHTDELPESPHFMMQTVRDDPLVGRDLKKDSAAAPSRFEDAPYLTAELGGGMQPTDHRRVVAFPRDTEALAFCKLGSGANLLGYYMYHGGTNPDGRLSTLQESRETGYPNDLPVKSYDFEAPLGECGLASESCSRLRRLHLFVREWGELLAPSEAVISPDSCRDPADREALRWSFRYNPEADCGFVFVNNHLRKRVLPDRENVRLTVKAGGREYPLPPVTVKNGENAILPYRLPLGSALLLGSNASPLTRLGNRYFFYTDEEPVYAFEGEPAEIVTLTREQARMAVKLGERLYISPDPLFEKDGKVYVETDGDAVIDVYEETGEPRRLTVSAPPFSGGVSFRETAPGVYELSLRYGGGFDDCVLELAFAGDKARLYLGDRLIADRFSTGLPFCTSLRQHGFPEALRLELDGPRAGVYRDIEPLPGCGLKNAGLCPVCRLPVNS